NGSVLATDRGGGYINVWGGTYSAAGQDSAGVYSTGTIIVNSAHVYSTGGEAVVIEGANSALLTNCTISGVTGTRDRGIFIYQSMSGDSTGYLGAFTMVGGSYTWPSTSGPAFYLTNTKGTVYLCNVLVTNASGILLECTTNQWGTAGANGGTANFTADNETLTGSVISDSYSTNFLTLTNSTTLTGCINAAQQLTICTNSIWNAQSNSVVITLIDSGTINLNGTITTTNVLVKTGGSFGGGGSVSSNLTVNAGATLVLNPATNVAVGGSVIFGGAVTVAPSTTNISTGTYKLLTYGKSLSGSPSFTYSAPSGSGQTASFSTATSGVVYVTISVPVTVPAAPANVTATAGDAQVALKWAAVTNATSYYVKRALASGGSYAAVTCAAATNFLNSSLTNGTLYYYVVTATNSAGESSLSSEVSARPISSVSTNLSFSVSSAGLQISWPADHTGWKLQAQTNSLSAGLGTNWADVASSTITNQMSLPVVATNGGVFFRLVQP
ncbi:MAG: fibronectin type III domain-containing protein, partial [Verrucomicrobiae bacterium]|nr:fibronectin type III domain-containing protein [Verrucomicrobiae bacterium]